MTQSDIINNNFSKAFECIKCSNAYDTGEVLSEEKLFKQISERKHSTFDRSKFNVVGSPTITEDGVASGFSATNYITGSLPSAITLDKVDIYGQFTTGSVYTTFGIIFNIGIIQISQAVVQLGIQNSKKLGIGCHNDTSWQGYFSTNIVSDNTTYYYHIYYDNALKLDILTNSGWENWITANPTVNSSYSSTLIQIGSSGSASGVLNGTIDLKNFSITLDDKEVFSGNKTGLDVIKPDNYTVVGSPVISENGVALTTSTDNYIKTSVVNFSTASTWKIKGKFKAPSTAVESNILAGITNQYLAIVFNGVSKNIRIALGDGSSWFISNATGASNLSLNTEYEYEFIYDGTGYLLNLNGSEYISKQTSASKVGNTSILLGVNRDGFEPFANDKTIDLNAFKIYVDGNLVYQPCLKIPYTQSKTGSKIVDVAYRDRVIDLYEQEGQAGYYTIDEENQNFTLPMGEIYGMIEDTRASIPTKISQLTDDSTFVHKTGNETVAGVKTFSATINGNTTSASKLNGFGTTRTDFWRSVNATAKTGKIINSANTPNDGAYIFSERKLNNGANLDFIIDGKFYQNEGAYQVLDTSTGVTHTTNTAVGSTTKPVYINSNGVATVITSYEGNSATATKATQDSSGNQINTSYQPLKYSKYSISTYASSNPYIKLATFTNTATIDHCSILFWVEILQAGVNKAYALCRLSLERRNSSVSTVFEIFEKYGNSTLCKNFDTLTLAYSVASNTVCEIWMSTYSSTYTTYYLRPTDCNEYGDYGQTPVTMASNKWTYYNKSGNSTSIASTAITSGYTQVKITDKSTAKLLNNKVDTSSLTECQVVINTYVNGTSGYRIWSDGYCEQWGRGALNEIATTTITLLKAYKDTNYSVSAISITASTAQDSEVGLQCTPKSATQITLTAHYLNPNNQTACWETKGYLAEGEY